jgi:acetyltransferase-like isoleucine patch superfamily enzyme
MLTQSICRRVIDIKLFFTFVLDKLWSLFYKNGMKSCGKGVHLRPMSSDLKGLWNLSVGNYTNIPKRSTFYCTNAPLIIGKKVIFGPNPTIITGDHRIDVVGKFIIDSKDKLPENDAAVVIGDDVWVGANVTILKGVTIGRGSVVAAGAVVTRSCSPYSIIGGIPARVIKKRFTLEQILQHEKVLYSENERYTQKEIMAFLQIKQQV